MKTCDDRGTIEDHSAMRLGNLQLGGPGNDEEFIRKLIFGQKALHAFILGMTPSRADADDILQEVNLALWRKRGAYQPDLDFLRWAFGFAVLEVRHFRSGAANKQLWFSDIVLDSLAGDWHSDAKIEQQRHEALVVCLAKLGSRDKRFVSAFYRGEISAKQLAEEAGKPLRTIYNILGRARELLRKCVEQRLADCQHP